MLIKIQMIHRYFSETSASGLNSNFGMILMKLYSTLRLVPKEGRVYAKVINKKIAVDVTWFIILLFTELMFY